MLVAPQGLKNVLPVEDSFSNKEMRRLSRIRAHQSTNETQVCEGQKQSQLLSTTSPLWFWRRIRLVVHILDKFLYFLCCGTSCFKNDFHHNVKRNCFSFQPVFPHFFRYIGWPESPETNIVTSRDSVSHLISPAFR